MRNSVYKHIILLAFLFAIGFSFTSKANTEQCSVGPHGKLFVLKRTENTNRWGMTSSRISQPSFNQQRVDKFSENESEIKGFFELYLDEDRPDYEYERLREHILSFVKFEEPFIISAVGGNKPVDNIDKGLNYFRIDGQDVNILGQWVTNIDSDNEEIFIEVSKARDHYLFRFEKSLLNKCKKNAVAEAAVNPSAEDVEGTQQKHEHGEHPLSIDADDNSDEAQIHTNNPEPPSTYLFTLPTKEELDPIKTGFLFGPRLFGTNNIALKEKFLPNEEKAWPLTKKKSDLISADEVPETLKKQKFYTVKDLMTRWNRHIGIDVRVPVGTETFAIAEGKVFAIGYLTCPGYTVAVEHNIPGHKLPVYAVYKHLSSRPVQVIETKNGQVRVKTSQDTLAKGEKLRTLRIGDKVTAGDLVAFSGGSGLPMSLKSGTKQGCIQNPHLHFEIRIPKTLEDSELIQDTDDFSAQNLNTTVLKKISQIRLNKLEKNAVAVNPADYIQDVDRVCYEQKVIEIENAQRIEKYHPDLLPQLSAGLCSHKAEKAFAKYFSQQIPKIYEVKSALDIPTLFPASLKKPNLVDKLTSKSDFSKEVQTSKAKSSSKTAVPTAKKPTKKLKAQSKI